MSAYAKGQLLKIVLRLFNVVHIEYLLIVLEMLFIDSVT